MDEHRQSNDVGPEQVRSARSVTRRHLLKLTAAGALAEVRPLGTSGAASDALARQIASLLSQWQFRPAMQDKVPVQVEFLLIISPRS